MIYVYLFLNILLSIISILITKKKTNPVVLFNTVWFGIIFLYQFKLSYLQQDLTTDTYIVMILALLAFFFSFFICSLINHRLLNKTENNERIVDKDIINIKKINLIFLFWIIISIVEIVYSGGLPLIWKLTGSSKTYFDFGIPSVHGFMNSIGLVLLLLYYFIFLKNHKVNKSLSRSGIFHIIFILGYYLFLITRQILISGLIELAVITIYYRKFKGKKFNYKNIPKIILAVIILIIAFGIIGNVRTGYSSFMNVAMFKYDVSNFFAGFAWVYMYLTMTLANINKLVSLSFVSLGSYPVLNTFIPTVISKIIYSSSSISTPTYLVTSAFNVSGYFVEFYLGYKLLGVIIITSLYGIFAYIFYRKVNNKLSLKNVLYYSVMVQIILLSFFYNHLLYLPSSFQFVVIYVIFHFVLGKGEIWKK